MSKGAFSPEGYSSGSHEASKMFAHALDEILTPDSDGIVTFGATNEPLRLSQIEALTAMKKSRLGHIVQPGGTGKTREAIVAAYAMHQQGENTLYVVPSQQAVQDFAKKAKELCPDIDVGTVYQIEKCLGRLTFITYASLLRCILGEEAEAEADAFEEQIEGSSHLNGRPVSIHPTDYELVVWDEAHWYLTLHARQLVKKFAHAINLALTATPRYYKDKEVGQVFGERLHTLDLRTAVERKEICDFRNVLVRTDVRTGLNLSSPEQEESEEVARAIDIPQRNKIFCDLYLNGRTRVGEKVFPLAGEPTIVFGAGINHVHNVANAFNDVLTEALRSNELFRCVLRSKGIDPDAVEQIAAPIHSGGTDKYASMNLDMRNNLVDRYHQRKVLILVATSVLQQSFDSPMTSVVMDSVPRQSYVAVGQAAMRALRYLPGKDMALIINTQDADHPSLTFTDFQGAFGREEGVIVEIKKNGNTQKGASSNGQSEYTVTFGAELLQLSQQRREQEARLSADDGGLKSLPPEELEGVNTLLQNISAGDQNAVWELFKMITPRMQQECALIKGSTSIDEATADTVLLDVYTKLMPIVQSGRIWVEEVFYGSLAKSGKATPQNRTFTRQLLFREHRDTVP